MKNVCQKADDGIMRSDMKFRVKEYYVLIRPLQTGCWTDPLEVTKVITSGWYIK